ncbi:MFS transporter [Candidatus Uabimicrobium amorphum]|uniref:Regulatory protein UhpC n=1 Tax=Uabimicrobium amorphum TaxID=2596890 RepID=A0A5S9F4I3_UABAM|nr:MFS transporter [Candidatus Uabimicrobium amorphum]BBM84514.1 regulatory protein UhpC [Candidatus Uabimicrobium amorphum]
MSDLRQNNLVEQRTNWEYKILGSMYIGYMAFILCRTAISACSPEMIKDPTLGFDEDTFSKIAFWGTIGMVTGKLLTGVIADRLGGRTVYLVALTVTAIITVALSTSSYFVMFATLNFIMLFAAAAGWPAMANLISNWYHSSKFGRVWGIISTSSRLSAVLSALFLGYLLSKMDWQYVFCIAGGVGLAVVALIFFYLKGHPRDVGLSEVEPKKAKHVEDTPTNLSHALDDASLKEALITFATSGRFWLMCLSLMCTTVLMEFIVLLPLYIDQSFDVPKGYATITSAIFPTGCLIALVGGGFVYDGVSRKGRIALLGGLLTLTCFCVATLLYLPSFGMSGSAKFFIAVVTLFFFGLTVAPAYYLPMSIFSVEFGGIHCGLLIGIIDATGYGASALYLWQGGSIVKDHGWGALLQIFLVIAVIATLITAWFAYEDYKKGPKQTS